MRSIQARFQQQEKATPNAGAYINLQRAIRGKRFLRKDVEKAFNTLVPKADYLRSEKASLLEWLDFVNIKPRKPQHAQI